MIDVKTFLSALKINWIKKIVHNDGENVQILTAMYPFLLDLNKFGCEFLMLHSHAMENFFWADVLKHLKLFFNVCISQNFNDFVAEPIHYNSAILRDNQTICIRNWIKNDILYIGHLCGFGRFLTFEEFKARFPLVQVDFLVYQGILNSVKKHQRGLGIGMSDEFHIDEPLPWKQLKKGGVKSIYWTIIEKNNVSILPTWIEKWSKELNCEIDIKKIFSKLKHTTVDTSLRWFQYKVMYRLLPTGRFLFIRHMADSSNCSFCNISEETLIHLLWECPHVRGFWSDVQTWININFSHCFSLVLSKELVIFGLKPNTYTDRIIDLFILMAKYYVFVSKLQGNRPHLNGFLNIVRQRYKDTL